MIVNNREKQILRETVGFLSSGMSRPRGIDKGPFFAAECETNPTVQLSAEASGQNSTPLHKSVVETQCRNHLSYSEAISIMSYNVIII